MKTFKEYLKEEPLPSEVDPEKFKVKPESEVGMDIFKQLEIAFQTEIVDAGLGTVVATGSARRVYEVAIEKQLITKKMDKQIELDKSLLIKGSTKLRTMIKVAKNQRGLIQNLLEYQSSQKISKMDKEISKWFAPCFDQSEQMTKIKGAKVDKGFKRGYTFVQMMPCKPVHVPIINPLTEFPRLNADGIIKFQNAFGIQKQSCGRAPDWKVESNTDDFSVLVLGKLVSATAKASERGIPKDFIKGKVGESVDCSDSQFENIYSLAMAVKETKASDFVANNMGIYKGHIVLLDYGFATGSIAPKIYASVRSIIQSLRISEDEAEKKVVSHSVSPTGAVGFKAKPTKPRSGLFDLLMR